MSIGRGKALLVSVLVTFFLVAFPGAVMTQGIGGFPVYKERAVPLPVSREALGASLKEVTELTPAVIAHLTGQAAPAVLLITAPALDASIPVGNSKVGGAPDLPLGAPWPVRPPYPDAQVKRDRYRLRIGQTLAKAGIAPDWMTPNDGKRYVEERRRIEREAAESTLNAMPSDLVAQMRPIFEAERNYTPERAREETRHQVLQAQVVGESLPLSFIMQLDLGALSAETGFDPDFPRSGRLLLFYDRLETPPGWEPGSRAGFRLIWDETPLEDLRRASVPQALTSIDHYESLVLEPGRITARSVFTPITPSERAWDAIPFDSKQSDNFGVGPYWAYAAWLGRFGSPDDPDRTNHQLGGWAQPLQNGMQAEAQLASKGIAGGSSDAYKTPEANEVLKGAADWKLVLQIGVDETVGLRAGAYYVLMRRNDLLARHFDKAWVIYQSS
jgi:uncharacterized protein YwqG